MPRRTAHVTPFLPLRIATVGTDLPAAVDLGTFN